MYAHKIIVSDKSAFFEGFFVYREGEPSTDFVRIINAEFSYETMFDPIYYIYYGTTYSTDGDSSDIFQKYSNL